MTNTPLTTRTVRIRFSLTPRQGAVCGLACAVLGVLGAVSQARGQGPTSGSVDPGYPVETQQIVVAPGLIQGLTDRVRAPNGGMYLTGTVTDTVPNPDNTFPVVTKLLPSGEVDTAYGTNGTVTLERYTGNLTAQGHVIALLPGGEMAVASGRGFVLVLKRLLPTGVQDMGFGTHSGETRLSVSGPVRPQAVLAQTDGKVLVLCLTDGPAAPATQQLLVVRYLPGGGLDGSFGTGGVVSVPNTEFQPQFGHLLHRMPDGSYRVAAVGNLPGTSAEALRALVLKLTSDGMPDIGYGTEGLVISAWLPFDRVHAMTLDPITSGIWMMGSLNTSLALMRLAEDGLPDTTFSMDGVTHLSLPNQELAAYDVQQRGDGLIYAAGTIRPAGVVGAPKEGVILRLQPTGEADTTFDQGRCYVVRTLGQTGGFKRLDFDAGGGLLAAGESTTGSQTSYGVMRLFAGELVTRFVPEITQGPVSLTVDQTEPASFSVVAGPNDLVPWYQWRRDGELLRSVTGPTLSLPQTQWSDQGNYTVQVGNFAGVVTLPFTLTVNAPPVITQQPDGYTKVGDEVHISVGVRGRPPLTYQWQRFGNNYGSPRVTDAMTDTLVLPFSLGYAGYYRVIITNAEGIETSQTLFFTPPPEHPIILAQPQPFAGLTGTEHSLLIQVSGRSPMSFQWQKDGVNVGTPVVLNPTPGKVVTVNQSLPIVLSPETAGEYRCLISNAVGTTATVQARVTVYTKPTVAVNTPRQILRTDKTLVLEASAFVTSPLLNLAWTLNGNRIPGANQFVYEVPAVTLAHAGVYRPLVNTTRGRINGESATVAVVDAENYRVVSAAGRTATLTVQAAGPGLYFNWRRVDGQPLAGPRFTGLHTRTLRITNCDPGSDAGLYVCDVLWAAFHGPTEPSGEFTLEFTTQRPVVQTSLLPSGQAGFPYSFALSAQHSAASYSAGGLPRGLKLNPATGVISGVPLVVGTFPIRITAANLFGTSAAVTLPLTISPVPAMVAGSYAGPSQGGRGYVQVEVSPTGAFTGKMRRSPMMGVHEVVSFQGQLQLDALDHLAGASTFFTLKGGHDALAGRSQLTLVWTPSTGGFVGPASRLLSEVGDVDVTLYKNRWHAQGNPATAMAGYSTLSLRPDLTPSAACGDGFGSVAVQPSGVVTFTGRTPDNAVFTTTSFLMADATPANSTFVHAWISARRSWVAGTLSGMSAAPEAQVTGLLLWQRPFSPPHVFGRVLNDDLTTFLAVSGSTYLPPQQPGVTTDYMLNVATPGHVSLTLEHPTISGPFTTTGSLSTHHVLTPAAYQAGDAFKLTKLTFHAATGFFTGAGTHYLYHPGTTRVSRAVPAALAGAVVRLNALSPTGTGRGFATFTSPLVYPHPVSGALLSGNALESARLTVAAGEP